MDFSCFEELEDGAVVAFELFEVLSFVVGCLGLPHAEENPDPFVGSSSYGGVVFHALGKLHIVERFGSAGPFPGMVSELVKRLPQEFRTSQAFANMLALLALFGDRQMPLLRMSNFGWHWQSRVARIACQSGATK